MRLFLGILPPPAIAESLAASAQEVLRGAVEKLYTAPDLHLTLVFLGEVAPDRTHDLERSLGPSFAEAPPMPLTIGGTGSFGHPGPEWALWAGIEAAPVAQDRLAGLVARGRRWMQACGIDVPVADLARPFTPHVTLARPRARERVPAAFRSLRFDLPWVADEVHLCASVGGAGPGPRYPVLASQRLLGR